MFQRSTRGIHAEYFLSSFASLPSFSKPCSMTHKQLRTFSNKSSLTGVSFEFLSIFFIFILSFHFFFSSCRSVSSMIWVREGGGRETNELRTWRGCERRATNFELIIKWKKREEKKQEERSELHTQADEMEWQATYLDRGWFRFQ